MEYIAFKDLLDEFAPANGEIPAAMLRQLAQLDRNGHLRAAAFIDHGTGETFRPGMLADKYFAIADSESLDENAKAEKIAALSAGTTVHKTLFYEFCISQRFKTPPSLQKFHERAERKRRRDGQLSRLKKKASALIRPLRLKPEKEESPAPVILKFADPAPEPAPEPVPEDYKLTPANVRSWLKSFVAYYQEKGKRPTREETRGAAQRVFPGLSGRQFDRYWDSDESVPEEWRRGGRRAAALAPDDIGTITATDVWDGK